MGLSTNVAGIFSRYFVVGFVLPAFVALAVLDGLVPQERQPPAYAELSGGNELAALSGAALLLGLLLSAVHTGLLWVLDGWPVYERNEDHVWKALYKLLVRRSRRDFEKLSGTSPSEDGRRRLRERFPADGDLLPTRLGNARRAAETHPHTSHHLDGVQALARVRFLLSDAERQQLADAEGDLAFMVNGLTLVAPVTAILTVLVWSEYEPLYAGLSILAAGIVARILFELAVRVSADRWGPLVRAAFDLHLPELYDRLGVRRPCTPVEDLRVGEAVDARLVHGKPLDADVRRPAA